MISAATAPAQQVATLRLLASEGACRSADTTRFFPQDPTEAEYALSVCAGCPVQLPCRRYALSAGELFGIWGGMTEEKRRAYRRRQRLYHGDG